MFEKKKKDLWFSIWWGFVFLFGNLDGHDSVTLDGSGSPRVSGLGIYGYGNPV